MTQRTSDRPLRVGVFDTVAQAERAVARLREAGFTNEQLSVACSDEHRLRHFGAVPKLDMPGSNTAPAIAIGGAVGAAVGGLILGVATLVTGGGALLIAGPAVICGGALAGTFSGAMMTRGVEKEAADYYDQAVQRGKILVAAELLGEGNADQLAAAERILAEAGAEPVRLVEG